MDFSTLKPLLGQLLLQAWNSFIYPELQKLEAQIGSEPLKIVADSVLESLNKLAQAELPKI